MRLMSFSLAALAAGAATQRGSTSQPKGQSSVTLLPDAAPVRDSVSTTSSAATPSHGTMSSMLLSTLSPTTPPAGPSRTDLVRGQGTRIIASPPRFPSVITADAFAMGPRSLSTSPPFSGPHILPPPMPPLPPPPPPRPPGSHRKFQGVAFDTGRLEECAVCLDGGGSTLPNRKCDTDEPHTFSSGDVGWYSLESLDVNDDAMAIDALAIGNVLIDPGRSPGKLTVPACRDRITGYGVTASMRCGATVCSPLSDIHAQLTQGDGGIVTPLEHAEANMAIAVSLIKLPAYVLDVTTTDGTSAPANPGVYSYALVMMELTARSLAVWERLGAMLVAGNYLIANQPTTLDMHEATDHPHLSGAFAPDLNSSLERLRMLRPLVLPPRKRASNRTSGSRSVLVSDAAMASGSRLPATDASAAVSIARSATMQSPQHAVQVTMTPWSIDEITRKPVYHTVASAIRGAIARRLPASSATPAFNLTDASSFVVAIHEAASVVGITLAQAASTDEVVDVAMAVANMVQLLQKKTRELLTDGYAAEGADPLPMATYDEWYNAMTALARGARVAEALNVQTYLYVKGDTRNDGYAALASFSSLEQSFDTAAATEGTNGLQSYLTVGCLDPTSDTFNRQALLNHEALCAYTSSPLSRAFLTMSWSEWLLFGLQIVAFGWLTMTVVGAVAFQIDGLCLKRSNAVVPERWPTVALLIPCYMPNEQCIIEETLEKCAFTTQYEGELRILVPYNSPVALPIDDRLSKLDRLNGHAFSAVRVPQSSSKAHNLDYAMRHMVGDADIIIIFDADHHPRHDTIAMLVRTLESLPDISCVQGAVLIERGGNAILRTVLDGMEWASWCFWAPGFGMVTGSAYFGGGNAAWRPQALHELGFDTSMLTEDIDISIRAMALGHRFQFAPWAQVGELCPPTIAALLRQRQRWAMGWEQVTAKRIEMLFTSSFIDESRKWRVMLLLMTRYVTILTSLLSIGTAVLHFIYDHILRVEFSQAEPLQWMSCYPTYLMFVFGSALVVTLVILREPCWRYVNVASFVPIASFYFIFQFGMIIWSWIMLSCVKKVTWQPTTRSKGAESHDIKLNPDTTRAE